jgi:hypothetical protein
MSHPPRLDALFHGQGRSERKAEEVHTALRATRSPSIMFLVNG